MCCGLYFSASFCIGTEVEYVHQACNTMETCLRLLAFILRAALLAKFEEGE